MNSTKSQGQARGPVQTHLVVRCIQTEDLQSTATSSFGTLPQAGTVPTSRSQPCSFWTCQPVVSAGADVMQDSLCPPSLLLAHVEQPILQHSQPS